MHTLQSDFTNKPETDLITNLLEFMQIKVLEDYLAESKQHKKWQ